jgi:hypothetical protein
MVMKTGTALGKVTLQFISPGLGLQDTDRSGDDPVDIEHLGGSSFARSTSDMERSLTIQKARTHLAPGPFVETAVPQVVGS